MAQTESKPCAGLGPGGGRVRSLAVSERWLGRAQLSLPGGVSSHFRRFERPAPLVIESGKGSRICDVEGNEYIDYVLGLGPLILGHCHPRLVEEICGQVGRGVHFGAQQRREVELAELVKRLVPSVGLVTFASTGTEAALSALRLARAYTRRTKFVKFEGHYHGWADSLLISYRPRLEQLHSLPRTKGVLGSAGQAPCSLDDVLVAEWNDDRMLGEVLRRHGAEIAAVIAEPIMCNNGCIDPAKGFLPTLRKLCDENHILLIFDEVITGFRVGLGGAQQMYDVHPDLTILGKALGGGIPISAVAGRADVFQNIAKGDVIHMGTFNGNPLAITSALTTLRLLEQEGAPGYRRLSELGRLLMNRLREAGREAGLPVMVQGPGAMFHMAFANTERFNSYRDCLLADTSLYQEFCARILAAGVRLMPRGLWYLSFAHSVEDIEVTVAAAKRVFASLRT